jgi:hypothetical protein
MLGSLKIFGYFCRMKKEVGKFLLDVAKLLIGGVLLTGVMRHDVPLRVWKSFILS